MHISDIKAIDSTGITYVNAFGETKRIIFANCRANWTRMFNADPSAFLTWDGYPIDPSEAGNAHVIGRHNYNDEVPYYEFFADTGIMRFEIDHKKGLFASQKKINESFLSIEAEIAQYGWSTYEM